MKLQNILKAKIYLHLKHKHQQPVLVLQLLTLDKIAIKLDRLDQDHTNFT